MVSFFRLFDVSLSLTPGDRSNPSEARRTVKNPWRSTWWWRRYRRHRFKWWAAYAIVFAALGGFLGWVAATGGAASSSSQAAAAEDHQGHQHTEAPSGEEEDAVWTCSMHPNIRRDGPGLCPICGMDLVPVASSGDGMRTITVTSTARKLMQIQTFPVHRRFVTGEVRMVGKVDYDETRLAHITAWVPGRLDRMFADFTGIQVNKGDHLVSIYSEQLYSAQAELIEALENRRNRGNTSTTIAPLDFVRSAREKLRLLGLTPEQISEIEQRGAPSDHITIYSPIGGIVIDKLRQEGDRVQTGDRIYTVADLSRVWVKLDAYESDLAWLRYGQDVEFRTEAYPGEVFHGRIVFIDPVLNPHTRTVKVRVNVDNSDGRLKPEMFVRAVVHSRVAAGGRVVEPELADMWICPMHYEVVKQQPGDCDICGMPLVRAEAAGFVTAEGDKAAKPLVVPASAPLITGKRAIVFVEDTEADVPTFEGREIVLGPRAGDYYVVRSGLEEGDMVVTHGNFKLDSALQIAAKPSMMTPQGGGDLGEDAENLIVSSEFREMVQGLLALRGRISEAAQDEDLMDLRAAFKEADTILDQADESELVGRSEALWGEFGMLLRNDVVLGQDVVTASEARGLAQDFAEHLRRASAAFGISPDPSKAPVARVEVPAAFRNELARLWQGYLPVWQHLAGDDFPAAVQAAEQLRSALNTIDASGLAEEASQRWAKEARTLEELLSRLTEAEDVTAARATFAQLSEEMMALIRTFGLEGIDTIYRHHCPMAFDGRGAVWLQDDDQTRNPYYGATMLRCADRVDRLEPPETP